MCNDEINYLEELSEEYNVHIDTVIAFAELLGPEEYYDGLISTLETAQQCLLGGQ